LRWPLFTMPGFESSWLSRLLSLRYAQEKQTPSVSVVWITNVGKAPSHRFATSVTRRPVPPRCGKGRSVAPRRALAYNAAP
jgi:hypothetical protein